MISQVKITSLSGLLILITLIFNCMWTLRLTYLTSGYHENLKRFSSTKNTQSEKCSNEEIKSQRLNQSSIFNDNLMLQNYSHLAFNNVNFNYGRSDNYQMYQIKDFALIGDKYIKSSEENLICLATQSSVERLYSLSQVSLHWNGPISVAVFVSGTEEFLILQYFVSYLRLCFTKIKDNMSFHIATPKNNKPKHRAFNLSTFLKFDCQYPEKTLRQLLKIRPIKSSRWRYKNVYPQNHMRNIARKGCQTKFVFLTDIDIIPSKNIVSYVNNFLSSNKCYGLCAYVVPTFELDVHVKFPVGKNELIRLVKKGLARPFHEKVFIYNQYATNFSRWIETTNSTMQIYNVTNFEFLYEPFYISSDDVPAHDERFLGYGFTRNSQVYEMFIAGYAFFVLSPVFTCHWGLQQKKTRPVWREQQNNINRRRFEIFKSEILKRYKVDKSNRLKTQ